jgi:hypothetical protein
MRFGAAPLPDVDGLCGNVTDLPVNPKGAFRAFGGMNHPSFTVMCHIRVR